MLPALECQLAPSTAAPVQATPAKDEQIRRYQTRSAPAGRARRVTSQAKADGPATAPASSRCSTDIRRNAVRSTTRSSRCAQSRPDHHELERLRTGGLGGADRENQRRSVIATLAQNNCGPQYAAAAREQNQGGGGFLGGIFGNNNNNATPLPPGNLGAMSGTYRTVCVRTCDGAYFPVSFATTPERFIEDEKTCKALCPATEASLYAYRNPGEDMNMAVSVSGQPYTALPNAFKFRASHDPTCSCKAAGQTWSDALKSVDDKAQLEQQGDIVVTEESAKKMQQQKMQAQQPKGQPAKKGAAPPATTPPPATAAAPPADAAKPADGKDKPIRSVGPTFIPNNNTTSR
jgi:hypothetical protein